MQSPGEDAVSSNDEAQSAERISDAEHAVMEALWRESPLSAADVCDVVCKERGWSIPTVKTLLSRLVAKGALATQPDGRRFLHHWDDLPRSHFGLLLHHLHSGLGLHVGGLLQ